MEYLQRMLPRIDVPIMDLYVPMTLNAAPENVFQNQLMEEGQLAFADKKTPRIDNENIKKKCSFVFVDIHKMLQIG